MIQRTRFNNVRFESNIVHLKQENYVTSSYSQHKIFIFFSSFSFNHEISNTHIATSKPQIYWLRQACANSFGWISLGLFVPNGPGSNS